MCREVLYWRSGHNLRYILIRETEQATQTFGPFSNPQIQMDRMVVFFFFKFSLVFSSTHYEYTKYKYIYIYIQSFFLFQVQI